MRVYSEFVYQNILDIRHCIVKKKPKKLVGPPLGLINK
jgi:hypothetical protein